MYRGRVTVGEQILLSLWTRNTAGTPTLPSAAPVARLYDEVNVLITAFAMPIHDRFHVTAYFQFNLFLGKGLYEPGKVRVRYAFTVGGVMQHAEDEFEIVSGGSDDGVALSSYFFRRPISSYLLMQGEGGRLLRKRNPQVTSQ